MPGIVQKQIRDTIKQFTQVKSVVGHAEHSDDLREFIKTGKKIIITTVQKFPYVLDEIGNEHRAGKFAIIIDEAHSSQGGRTSAKMQMVLAEASTDYIYGEEETYEDKINDIMETRKMLSNASYFAFTATPKNRTLEIFGSAYEEDDTIKYRPFHHYSMKQAIQEHFILDVLKNYTPVESYYRLIESIEDDPHFDKNKANKKLRKFVESNEYAIRKKAEIMIDHFHEKVIGQKKIGGNARAMVAASGIERAIQYFYAFRDYLEERKSPYRAIIAYSGEFDYGGQKLSDSTLNGFQQSAIKQKIREEPYRFLIVAEMFQTGYDEPLLHTMYMDKKLFGIRAVQTLSRLNRAHPQKHDTFVLDFMNSSDIIQEAFTPYYRTTILSSGTDPNKLHNLKADLDAHQVYSQTAVADLVKLFLDKAPREKLDIILDRCTATYIEELDEDAQVDFKGKAKSFVRIYNFLAAILPYTNAEWEKLSIFLNFLVLKLPAPREEDLSRGILEVIDMESYRVEMQATKALTLPDENGEIPPIPGTGDGHRPEPELEQLSRIIKNFNDLFGNIKWKDEDKIRDEIFTEIPQKVAANTAYRNAMQHSDKQNARIECDKALGKVVLDLLKDHMELYAKFEDNPDFRKWVADTIFNMTYQGQDTTRPVQE